MIRLTSASGGYLVLGGLPLPFSLPTSSSTTSTMSPSPALAALPSELIEHIVVLTAARGFPTAPAVLAQACRRLRGVIYHTDDQHLWRELFLVTFDDPRRHPDVANHADFDWGTAFRTRVWAAALLSCSGKPPAAPDAARAIAAVLDVLQSARSCPLTALSLPHSPAPVPLPGADVGESFTSQSAYPIFPPLQDATVSLNVEWVQSIFARGLPPSLANLLTGVSKPDGSNMQLIGQLVACTGFIPADSLQPPRALSPLDVSPTAQLARARQLARKRCYNMRFFKRGSSLGPFPPCFCCKSGTFRVVRLKRVCGAGEAAQSRHQSRHPEQSGQARRQVPASKR